MTGADLKAYRRAKGLSRRALADLAKLHPNAVRYWERKLAVNVTGHAPRRIFAALGIAAEFDNFPTPMRARGGVLCVANSAAIRALDGLPDHDTEILRPPTRARGGVLTAGSKKCGAKTRKGTPCRARVIPGKSRCKFHGGLSTGPNTPEGKARIAEAQRKRWQRWRGKQGYRAPQRG